MDSSISKIMVVCVTGKLEFPRTDTRLILSLYCSSEVDVKGRESKLLERRLNIYYNDEELQLTLRCSRYF